MLVPGITASVAAGGAVSRNQDIIVTEGAQNPSLFFYYGYNDPVNGSVGIDIGSVDPTTLDGNAIVFAYWYDFSTGFFYIGITGDFTATPYALFKSIIPEGAPRLLVKEARLIQYTASRNYTSWEWELPIPAQWDGVGTSIVSIEIDPLVYVVTEGTVNQSGTDFFGYNDAPTAYLATAFGSIAPKPFDGNDIVTVAFDAFTQDNFALAITGDFTANPEDLFEAVQPEGHGVLRQEARSVLQYNAAGDYTLWVWQDSVELPVTIPANWDGSGSSELTIYRPGHFVEPETKTFTVTQTSWTSGFERGFDVDVGGSRSPATFDEGTALLEASLFNIGADYPMQVRVKGLKPEGWMTSITPQGGATYTPSGFSQAGGNTSWTFITSNAGLGTTWDGVGDVTIDITIDPSAV